MPATSMRSFTATGTPASRPREAPPAARSAPSAFTVVMKAPSAGSMRSRAARTAESSFIGTQLGGSSSAMKARVRPRSPDADTYLEEAGDGDDAHGFDRGRRRQVRSERLAAAARAGPRVAADPGDL